MGPVVVISPAKENLSLHKIKACFIDHLKDELKSKRLCNITNKIKMENEFLKRSPDSAQPYQDFFALPFLVYLNKHPELKISQKTPWYVSLFKIKEKFIPYDVVDENDEFVGLRINSISKVE